MDIYASFDELLNREGIKFAVAENLSAHSTICLGGSADRAVFPSCAAELLKTIDFAKKCGVKRVVAGYGSNTLYSDAGYRGAVVFTRGLNEIYIEKVVGEDVFVRAMCGASLSSLTAFCLQEKIGGLEFLSGIPGSVGGAVIMNAGCFDEEISGKVCSVYAETNGKIKELFNKDCGFTYRKSRLKEQGATVISALFRTKTADSDIIKRKLLYYRDRRSNQPKGKSLGSVFKNDGIQSAKIIDDCGLKGLRVGGAFVSAVHANFIINDGTASSRDVSDLIEYVKTMVKARVGISLKEEIEDVGE